MNCYLYPDPTYLFFAPDLPGLLYYSHIPTAIIALFIGLFVFLHARHLLLNRLLLLIAACFSLWILGSLIAWTNNDGSLILFIWPTFALLSALIAVFSVYFTQVFVTKKDATFGQKIAFLLLLTPLLVFGPTDLGVRGFNLTHCDAFAYEGPLFTYYTVLGYIAMVWILFLLVKAYRTANQTFRKQILLMGIGLEAFLFVFFTLTFIAAYFVNLGVNADSRIEFFGLFGMTFFMAMMAILIVRFKTFNVGANASISLLISLIVLTGSQFTYVESRTGILVTAVTLIMTGAIGIMLMRSVKKEIRQREELENLTKQLAKANTRLKVLDKQKSEFVSIASHQLRSPLTAIRGYASLLIEGTYGKIPKKAIEPLSRVEESSRLMALAIEDYLNVSRIEAGNMKYIVSDFNLRDKIEELCDDLRPQAIKKGLSLIFRTDLRSKGIINADLGKTIQIIQNLVHNSIKYTEQGSIKVLMRDDVTKKKVYVDIIDTGIGMNQETLHTIFQKFERATNANTVNTSGTGLGLYVALKMAEAMGGTITARSDGDGKGSVFTAEFPLAM